MNVKVRYELTAAEKKALKKEINRQILENEKNYEMDFDAMTLWTLHVCFGFGKKRLKRFWNCFIKEHQRLHEHYELPQKDNGWLYKCMVKEHLGIDLEKWYQEGGEHRGEK